MGVIIRQGIKHSVVNFAGTLIGAISILFIYPYNDELYGFAQWLYSTAVLLVPMATLGVLSLVIKFYPSYKNQGKVAAFNGMIAFLLLIVFSLFSICFFLFESSFIHAFHTLGLNGELISEYKLLLIPLVAGLILENWLRFQSANHQRIVVPSIVSQFGYKLFLPGLVLLSLYTGITKSQAGTAIVFFYLLAAVVLWFYLRRLNALSFQKPLVPDAVGVQNIEVAKYALFGSLNSLGAKTSFRIDSVMIPMLLDFTSNGIYNKILFMSNVIGIPSTSIAGIAGPIISEALENKDTVKVKDIYKRSSSNLFLAGSLLFLLIWFNVEAIVNLSVDPSTFPFASKILLFLGLAKVIDMVTSLNSHILIYSSFYKYNLIFLLFLGVTNLILNYYWITSYGIVGAAMATFVSMFLYNFFKYLFIWKTMKMQPLSVETVKVLLVFGLCFIMLWFLPAFSNSFLHIIVYGCLTVGMYFIAVYFFRITEDSQQVLFTFADKLKLR